VASVLKPTAVPGKVKEKRLLVKRKRLRSKLIAKGYWLLAILNKDLHYLNQRRIAS
jgi:hypothetical protein